MRVARGGVLGPSFLLFPGGLCGVVGAGWWRVVWVGWFNRAMDAQCCAVGVSCGVVAVYCLFCGVCYRAGTAFQGRGGVWAPSSPGEAS